MKCVAILSSLLLFCNASFANDFASAKRADAAFYTSGFDGGDLKFYNFKCIAPVFPPVSTANQRMRRVDKSVKAWRECYARFTEKLRNSLPAGKSIPEDVVKTMSAGDIAKAKASMEKVYAEIAADARKQDDEVSAGNEKWIAATHAYSKGLSISKTSEARTKPVQ